MTGDPVTSFLPFDYFISCLLVCRKAQKHSYLKNQNDSILLNFK